MRLSPRLFPLAVGLAVPLAVACGGGPGPAPAPNLEATVTVLVATRVATEISSPPLVLTPTSTPTPIPTPTPTPTATPTPAPSPTPSPTPTSTPDIQATVQAERASLPPLQVQLMDFGLSKQAAGDMADSLTRKKCESLESYGRRLRERMPAIKDLGRTAAQTNPGAFSTLADRPGAVVMALAEVGLLDEEFSVKFIAAFPPPGKDPINYPVGSNAERALVSTNAKEVGEIVLLIASLGQTGLVTCA